MLKYSEVINTVVIEIICDKCEQICKKSEYASLSAGWNNESNHDLESYDFHICELCFFDIIKNFKNKSFKEIA